MVLTLNNTNTLTADNIIIGGTELSLIYATKNEIGNNAQISTNTGDIATLNFNSINAITTDLTNNYQTNSQLSSNFYNKTEIDTTLTNYYTSTQIDTNLSSNYQNNTLLATNFYNKGEVDTLIAGAGGGGGYTDTQIDDKLNSKADLSLFTDNVSFFPIIDLSLPSILHQGLTLKNSIVNIEPLEGVLFSNQFGAETDKHVAVFRNQTSYITLKGKKINCNATSNDNEEALESNNQGNGIVQIGTASTARVGIGASPNPLYFLAVAGTSSFDIIIRSAIRLALIGDMFVKGTGSDIVRPSATSDYTLRVRDNVGTFEFRNIRFGRTNGQMVLQDVGDCELFIGTEGTASVGVGTAPDANYFFNVGGTSNFNTARIANGLELENETANINNANGLTLYKDTTDASSVLTVKNAQGYIKFNSFNINAYNTSNDSSSLPLLNTADGNGCYCLSLGIGAIQGVNKLNVSGGNSNFGGTATFQNTSTFNADINVNNSGRIFQRADANSSLNVISTNEINFSLQSNRADDPTTGSIALQLNDTIGITINRAVTNNQTFNSIGNITAEANLNVRGDLLFQHSSAIYENLNGSDYDLVLRNGDTDRSISFIVGAIGSTPEISVNEANVNLSGHLDFTHSDVSGSRRVKIDNPDSDGIIFHSINGANIGEFSSTGLHINRALAETSDKRLKEHVKEIDAKKCVELVKYIKPKTYNYIGQSQKCVGYIADDFKTKKMPEEWDNIIFEGKDDYLRMDYGKTTPILLSALHALNKIDKLEKEVKALKGKGKGKSDSD